MLFIKSVKKPRKKKHLGVYVDGFNLYYGARELCGRTNVGWKWLDLEALVNNVLESGDWYTGKIDRIVYCTALRSGEPETTSLDDQKVYISALQLNSKVTVEFGEYKPKHAKGILAKKLGNRGRRYERTALPAGEQIPSWFSAHVMLGVNNEVNLIVNIETQEEKATDVNLASHLLVDIFSGRVDAVMVITNDGDLRFPLDQARKMVPVAVVNPNSKDTSSLLRGKKSDGVGGHAWIRLNKEHILNSQFPDHVGPYQKPNLW